MNARPNIVLVHGAWADGSCWSGVIERLQADGGHLDPRRTKTSPGLPGESGRRERAETALTGHVHCALADSSADLPASHSR
jgi:hypothetical protein